MRCDVVKTSRLPSVPIWGYALGALWAGLVVTVVAWTRRWEHPPTLCPFKLATGLPCPTCGATRATLALGEGDMTAAVLWNPLVVVLIAAGLGWLVFRLVTGRSIRLHLPTPRSRRLAWAIALVILAANWAYVLARGN